MSTHYDAGFEMGKTAKIYDRDVPGRVNAKHGLGLGALASAGLIAAMIARKRKRKKEEMKTS